MSEKQQLQEESAQVGAAAPSGLQEAQTPPQQGTIWPGPQQPVIIQVINQPITYEQYDSKKSRGLAISILVCSVAVFCCGIIGIAINFGGEEGDYGCWWNGPGAYYVGAGIWGGTVCILAGAFGIQAAKKKTRCWIMAHMVLSIIGSVLAGVMFALAAWATAEAANTLNDGFDCRRHHDHDHGHGHSSEEDSEEERLESQSKGALFISVVFLLASFCEVIVCIWSSTLGCQVLCCGNSSAQNAATQQNYVNMHGQIIPGAQITQITGPGFGQVPLSEAQAWQIPIQGPANINPASLEFSSAGLQSGAVQPIPRTPPPAYRQMETNKMQ